MAPATDKSLTIICPVFNEQVTVPLFVKRLEPVAQVIRQRGYEVSLTFIDNASVDQTQDIVRELCRESHWVSLLVMSRNFGYQCSVECGLRNTRTELSLVIDVDCEDPPEMALTFLDHIEAGFDVVYGERLQREESAILIWVRRMYYRVTRAAADEHFILDMAEFAMINREVREAVLKDQSSFPFIRASIGRVGYSRKAIPYKREKRIAGETHYNLWRMTVFGVAGILASSTWLLRVPTYLFPFWLTGIIGLGIAAFTGHSEYFYLMAILSFSYIGFTAAVISLYLARVYKNTLMRPNYHLNRKLSVIR